MQLNISPLHFHRNISPEDAQALFQATVTNVEIETFTFCNRKCWFCPNAQIDRRSENKYMDEPLYLRILADLNSINFGGTIMYSRYNEPLADRIILDRIRQARSALPKATLLTHTNGDYLNQEYLHDLKAAGLNTLRVQVYLGNDDVYDEQKMIAKMERRLKDLGLPFQYTKRIPNVHHAAIVPFDGMEITFDAWNFDEIGSDRAQLIQLKRKVARTSPCFMVFQHMYIDYDGSVVPCCNIRSDEPTHKAYVVDSLADGKSIFQAYANSALADWRRDLLTFGPKKPPCNTCNTAIMSEDPELKARLDFIASKVLGS